VILTPSAPHALDRLAIAGTIRAEDEDFEVDEVLDFAPAGEGEHLLLQIEKRGRNTEAIAHELARAFALERVAVSFAGRKDRHAVARQWFSVHTSLDGPSAVPPGCRILATTRHARKLRRGEIAANRFTIRLRALRGDLAGFDHRLGQLTDTLVPNYFGEQRFGHDGANVARARAYLCSGARRRVDAFSRGLHISVARAFVFNTVLAHRIELNCWRQSLPGDVAIDDVPTGPLWGRGRSVVTGCAAVVENDALAAVAEWLAPLEHVGLQQARRRLGLRVRDCQSQRTGDTAELSFTLDSGEYATAVLRELGDFTSPTRIAA
jgi:tRNA pseudouridine13 synthase